MQSLSQKLGKNPVISYNEAVFVLLYQLKFPINLNNTKKKKKCFYFYRKRAGF